MKQITKNMHVTYFLTTTKLASLFGYVSTKIVNIFNDEEKTYEIIIY